MNKIECGSCVNFQRDTKGTTKGPQPASFAWCKVHSVFPENGTVEVPEGAKTTKADRSNPLIVLPGTLKPHCAEARRQ